MHRLLTTAVALVALGLPGLACASTTEQHSPGSAPPSAGTDAPSDAGTGTDAPSQDVASRGRQTALFFGDSYFVGGGCSPDRTRDMAYVAGERLGYRPVVRGAGGTGFVADLPDYDLPPYLEQIAQGALDVDDPAIVVIEGGSNDLGYPLRPIRRHAREILQIAKQKYPEALLFLAGPMQTSGTYEQSRPVKRQLKRVSRSAGVPFINMLRWTEGHDEWICGDFVHPTYAGHRELGEHLADALAKRGA